MEQYHVVVTYRRAYKDQLRGREGAELILSNCILYNKNNFTYAEAKSYSKAINKEEKKIKQGNDVFELKSSCVTNGRAVYNLKKILNGGQKKIKFQKTRKYICILSHFFENGRGDKSEFCVVTANSLEKLNEKFGHHFDQVAHLNFCRPNRPISFNEWVLERVFVHPKFASKEDNFETIQVFKDKHGMSIDHLDCMMPFRRKTDYFIGNNRQYLSRQEVKMAAPPQSAIEPAQDVKPAQQVVVPSQDAKTAEKPINEPSPPYEPENPRKRKIVIENEEEIVFDWMKAAFIKKQKDYGWCWDLSQLFDEAYKTVKPEVDQLVAMKKSLERVKKFLPSD